MDPTADVEVLLEETRLDGCPPVIRDVFVEVQTLLRESGPQLRHVEAVRSKLKRLVRAVAAERPHVSGYSRTIKIVWELFCQRHPAVPLLPPRRSRGPKGPKGGTPRRKFTDSFELGRAVWIDRHEHGYCWEPLYGYITQISDYSYCVTADGCEYWIDHPRDIYTKY